MLAGLGLDFGLGFGALRIGGAGQHEVLPHHDAVLVAQVVELVGLVDAAAPGAHHIGVGFHKIADAALVVALGDTGDEGVVGNPVVAVRVHRHVVDVDLERTADVVGTGVHMHGTEADMAVPERFLGITGGDVDIVQRLVAVADGPPQLRFRHGDRQHGLVAAFGHDAIDGQIRAEAGDFGVHRHGLTDRMGIVRGHDASFAGAFDFDVHVEQSGAVGGDVDQRTDGCDAYAGPGVDADLAPDAGVGHVDAPIPAEGIARLADLVEGVVFGVRIVATGLFHVVGFTHGGCEGDGQFVGAVSEQTAHIPTVGTVEVAGGGDRAAVQCDVGDGVEAVGHQVVTVGAVILPIETAGESPIDIADPLLLVLVVAVERVVDQTGVEQVKRGLSRHSGRNARGERRAQCLGSGFRVDGGQRPALVQRSKRAGDVRHGESF